jgi:plasmid segregation protein ParM
MMVGELYKEKTLITGIDAGNTSTKVSYLEQTGNISDFAISTIIAPAPIQAVEMKDHKNLEVAAEDYLHVRITTSALDGLEKEQGWYVGEYAKDKKDVRQPELDSDGESKEKFSSENKAVFIVPMLSGLALAAVKAGKEDEVEIPLSTGIPIETFKLRQDKLLDLFYGSHEIKFLDGPFKGKVIKIHINSGEIQVEAVTTSLAVEFDINNGECIETEIGKKIGLDYALNDLGAGTTDTAVFNEHGIDKEKTHNTMIGTNKYIDQILRDIAKMPEFQLVVETLTEEKSKEVLPFPSREKFVNEILKPELLKKIEDESYEVSFKVSWGWVKNVDVTEIVNRHLAEYAVTQKSSLLKTYAKSGVDNFLLVGGGVLFGYSHGLKELTQAPFNMIIPKLKEAQFFTSRGFLIANYLIQLERMGQVTV